MKQLLYTIVLIVFLLMVAGPVVAQQPLANSHLVMQGCVMSRSDRYFAITAEYWSEAAYAGHFGYSTYQDDTIQDIGVFQPGEVKTFSFVMPSGTYATALYTWEFISDHWRQRVDVTFLNLLYDKLCSEVKASSMGFDSVGNPTPGCDQFMPVDDTARLATFVADTPFYWAPIPEGVTPYVAYAGQTAWEIDRREGYAVLIWACNVLFVPEDAVQ